VNAAHFEFPEKNLQFYPDFFELSAALTSDESRRAIDGNQGRLLSTQFEREHPYDEGYGATQREPTQYRVQDRWRPGVVSA
jgi:hypothetical protein